MLAASCAIGLILSRDRIDRQVESFFQRLYYRCDELALGRVGGALKTPDVEFFLMVPPCKS